MEHETMEEDIGLPTWDLYEMIQAFIEAPSYHLIFEAALIIWIIRLLFFTPSYKPETVLTEKEKQQLIDEWQPEPLVPKSVEENNALKTVTSRIVQSMVGKYVNINGKECLNLASLNFLGMIGRVDIEDTAVATLRKYGVGTCGPRGFYGTMDVHLELEDKLAKFMQCEEAIIYAYGFATIASAIPAYSKRGDVIFCDEAVCFSIQQGILASRSKVVYFKHNDMEDLERCLMDQQVEDKKNPKKAKATRRFLVVEGLYMNRADICPLPKLVELKYKYKVRIFMDESLSFGVLGKTGRGVTEHFGISTDEIDLLSASLENSMASIGGFCCGKAYVIDHQRLSGQGYCFSASAPALSATTASKALAILESAPDMLTKLRTNAEIMHQKLMTLSGFICMGEIFSPVKHLYLAASKGSRQEDAQVLQDIVQRAESEGLALTQASYLENDEHMLPPPSIRVAVMIDLTEQEIDSAVAKLKTISEDLL